VRRRWLYAMAAIAALIVVAALVARPASQQDPGAGGYRIAAQYFSAPNGPVGPGLNLALPSVPWPAAREAARAGAQVVVLASPDNLRALRLSGRLVPAPTWVRPGWPDPVTAGVRRLRSARGATCLTGSQLAPVLGTSSCVVLSYLPLGHGGFWLLADPTMFTNAGIVLPGHLELLANMVRAAGPLRFVVAGLTPATPAPQAVSPLRIWVLFLLPALLALLGALYVRFGPVRSAPAAPEEADAAQSLADLLRRHQAGGAALRALVDRSRAGPGPEVVARVERRLEGGPVRAREAAQWFRRLRGGDGAGRERDR
jgi:hypothetical protein